jgi:hypothetical protein
MKQRLGRRRTLVAEAAALVLITGMLVAGHGSAFGAVNCDSVFQGATPQDPITKTANVTTAHPGDSVTFTFTWNKTGTATAELADCFRVDDGSDPSLNALVSSLNWTTTHDNSGPDPQVETQTVVIPNDAALIGHTVQDRAKATFGSVESRSDIISVTITAAPSSSPTVEPTLIPPVSTGPTTSVKGVTLSGTGADVAATMLLALMFLGAGALLRRANRSES